MSQEADLLRARSLLNRNLYQQKMSDATEAQQELSSPTIYQAFDAERGLARLKDSNGNILYGSAQTNGAVGKGENIRLRGGGVLAKYDEMPTRKQQQITGDSKNETFYFAALLSTGHFEISFGVSPTSPREFRIGLETRTVFITYAGGGLGGDRLIVSYEGFSMTTEPTSEGGFFYNLQIEYNPSQNADGYIRFSMVPGSPTSTMGVSVSINPVFYVCDGKRIKKLDYDTAYAKNGLSFRALPSVVNKKIYVTFKENLPVSTQYFRKITILEINRRSLITESVQVFEYSGEDSIELPNNQDWRKSFTHSFLEHPPLDSVGCINSYRENTGAHLNLNTKIINTANYLGTKQLVATEKLIFQSTNFNPNSNICKTSFKKKSLTLNTTAEIAAKAEYCTIIGLCVYE